MNANKNGVNDFKDILGWIKDRLDFNDDGKVNLKDVWALVMDEIELDGDGVVGTSLKLLSLWKRYLSLIRRSRRDTVFPLKKEGTYLPFFSLYYIFSLQSSLILQILKLSLI